MTSSHRRAYVDWARGLAVLLMIEAHTIDAWVRLRDRSAPAYGWATIFGGFAAPMFLWLAGLAVVLSASRTEARTGSHATAVRVACERGLEIFVLAFLFRLQAFIVSPGSHPVTLFRVDVLNIMGPSMVAAALLFAVPIAAPARVVLYSAIALAVAMATPLVRAAEWVGSLPLWFQWYLRPAADYTTFTLFPWSGFVFAGAAAGSLLVGARDPAIERRYNAGLALAGAALVAIGFYAATQRTIYAVPASFWTSSPTWFAIRIGILMMALAGFSFLPPLRILEPLAAMGRASLFIYWIHVELVYGYASWLWRHRLPLWAWALGYVTFSVVMYRAIGWRDRFLAWRGRRIPRSVAVPQA
jgi:uncharacterized membrane protein